MDYPTPSTEPNGGPAQDSTDPVPATPARAQVPPPRSIDRPSSGDRPPPAIPRWAPADLPSGPARGSRNAPSNPAWAPAEPRAGIAWGPPGPPRGGAPRGAFDEEREARSSRLRNVTVGLAAAGFVAVGGFAVLAANGFTGVNTAASNGGTTSSGATNPGPDPGGIQPGASAAPNDQGVFGEPPSFGGDDSNGGGFFQPNNNGSQSNGGFFQPPSIGVGPGHASSGGS
jgi:hypothetical protein